MFAAGGVFIAPGGHPVCGGDTWCSENLAAEIANANEAREWVGRYADSGVDLIVQLLVFLFRFLIFQLISG